MRFFVHDPECGDEFFDTAEEAKAHAESLLDTYRDASGDGWDECVTNICWGEVREQCVQTKCEPAPTGSQFDEIWDFGLRPVNGLAAQRDALRVDRDRLRARVAELERERDAILEATESARRVAGTVNGHMSIAQRSRRRSRRR